MLVVGEVAPGAALVGASEAFAFVAEVDEDVVVGVDLLIEDGE
ncbi:MAG: hypothetical protein ACRYF3_01160 [Janthinobacterium lividum]